MFFRRKKRHLPVEAIEKFDRFLQIIDEWEEIAKKEIDDLYFQISELIEANDMKQAKRMTEELDAFSVQTIWVTICHERSKILTEMKEAIRWHCSGKSMHEEVEARLNKLARMIYQLEHNENKAIGDAYDDAVTSLAIVSGSKDY